MLGLYVHVPFCAAICNYCNFNRGLFDPGLKTRYVEALVREIARAGGAGEPADTVYFGGGTPSLLEPGEVARVIEACASAFSLAPDTEITLEANPETVDRPRLAAFRDAGVNRLSFGVQSFRDDELVRLSRLHGSARAASAAREGAAAGFDNISLDLMMWLPGQSVSQWLESVDAAIGLAPAHLSLYLLEVYANAPLREEMARARWSQAPDDDAAAMYLEGLARLDAAGYAQYEISNVARPGKQSRHNLKYWTDGEWHGFGCGAHGTLRGVRSVNVASTVDYLEAVEGGCSPVREARAMDEPERLGDALFMGLRLTEGVDLEAVGKRYGVDPWARFGADLAPFVSQGLLWRTDSRLGLTRAGMLVANEIMMVFV